MDDVKLTDKLLTRAEGKDLDFKSVPIITNNQKDKARFMKNLICMANTPREGSAYIISGVVCKQDGSKEIIGVPESSLISGTDVSSLSNWASGLVDSWSYGPQFPAETNPVYEPMAAYPPVFT